MRQVAIRTSNVPVSEMFRSLWSPFITDEINARKARMCEWFGKIGALIIQQPTYYSQSVNALEAHQFYCRLLIVNK